MEEVIADERKTSIVISHRARYISNILIANILFLAILFTYIFYLNDPYYFKR